VRRAVDILGATLALCVLVPVMLLLALVARCSIGRPILFGQQRSGRNGREFTMWKFRTMTDARDEKGALRSDDERLTRTGRWLRATSLDELPELWNVLCGEMSFIGPRPLPIAYMPRYSPFEARRHEVRPGITGWAQVNGRNMLDWDERLAMDVWYVDHRSFLLDCRIILKTVAAVVAQRGVHGPGTATMMELRPHLSGNLEGHAK